MNSKIIKQLQVMFTASPQLMRDSDLLRKAINGTFGVDINMSTKVPDKADVIAVA